MDDLLTTAEAAKKIGVNASRIRQLILSGDLPAEKFGRDHMIKESDLEKVRERPSRGRPSKKKE